MSESDSLLDDGIKTSGKKDKPALRLLVYSSEYSTRFLFRVSITRDYHKLDFLSEQDRFYRAVADNTHDIYFIDVCDGKGGPGQKIFSDINETKFKGLRRVILITSERMPPEANHMAGFGPLCCLEYNFTRKRFDDTVEEALEIIDTGSRVTIDPRFFDISVFKS